jgi:hypothetical protein
MRLLPGRPEAQDLVVGAGNSKLSFLPTKVESDHRRQLLGTRGMHVGAIEVLGHLDVDLVTVSPDNRDRVDPIR